MRTLIYAAAVSLDGFLAGPDEAMDWLRFSDDAAEINRATWQGVDTILLGRKTWQFAARAGGADAFNKLESYVFSRALNSVQGAELVTEDAAGFVGRLKSAEGGRILLMGGGELATVLIAAGLVDEIALNVHPVLLGDGTRMLGRLERRLDMDLAEARPIARGCFFARYIVATGA